MSFIEVDSYNGFSKGVIAAHKPFNIGDLLFIKPIEFRFSSPTLYAVIDGETGKETGEYIDGNEFKNRFKVEL